MDLVSTLLLLTTSMDLLSTVLLLRLSSLNSESLKLELLHLSMLISGQLELFLNNKEALLFTFKLVVNLLIYWLLIFFETQWILDKLFLNKL